MDPETLVDTVAQFNLGARDGLDPQFRRGEDEHSRYRGDQAHRPNPSLGALRAPPFYAVRMQPGDIGTVAGLSTDEFSRVLNRAGAAFGGLYALGLDMNSFTCGHYPAGGTGIGSAMTFAYIASMHIASDPPARAWPWRSSWPWHSGRRRVSPEVFRHGRSACVRSCLGKA